MVISTFTLETGHVFMSLISGIAYFKFGDVKKNLALKEGHVSLSWSLAVFFFPLSMALSCNLEAMETLQPLV